MIRRGKTLILTDKGKVEDHLTAQMLRKQLDKLMLDVEYLKKEIVKLKEDNNE